MSFSVPNKNVLDSSDLYTYSPLPMFTTYPQAVDYLYRNLPMFQRVGAAAIKKDLTNTIKICAALGNPHEKFRSVHVAGTNGKGSTAHMIASVLQSAGYKTGLYTSPHLKSFTERIRVDGKEIEQLAVTDFVNDTLELIEEVKPSFFEITVGMAFRYFAERKVDVAVIEVGMGGRLDSTNIIHPELSVITNIGCDHADLLGNTLQSIAREKAGIIKSGVPVVISEMQEEVAQVFEETARERHADIVFAEESLSVRSRQDGIGIMRGSEVLLDGIVLDLMGNYQQKNILGVVQAVMLLRERGFAITDGQIRHGLGHVIEQTGLKGRWQQLGTRPLVFCDTAHNAEGLAFVVRQIRSYSYGRLHMVLGVSADKDTEKIFRLLPIEATYYFCQAKLPRAMEANLLAEKASANGLSGTVIPDVREAIQKAMEAATADDFVFIGGSTFVVSEIEGL